MQSARGYSNDANPEAGMHEGLVQVFAFERRHSPIFSRFSVEDEIRCDDGASDDCCAIQKLLGEVTAIGGVGGLLHVRSLECILKRCLGFAQGR
jgi:hypothetical protein